MFIYVHIGICVLNKRGILPRAHGTRANRKWAAAKPGIYNDAAALASILHEKYKGNVYGEVGRRLLDWRLLLGAADAAGGWPPSLEDAHGGIHQEVEAGEEVACVAGRSVPPLPRQVGGGAAVGFGHVQRLVVVLLVVVVVIVVVVGVVVVVVVLQVTGHLS